MRKNRIIVCAFIMLIAVAASLVIKKAVATIVIMCIASFCISTITRFIGK